MSTEEEALIQLKRIFPDHDSEQLKSILRTALSLNDAIDIVKFSGNLIWRSTEFLNLADCNVFLTFLTVKAVATH